MEQKLLKFSMEFGEPPHDQMKKGEGKNFFIGGN